MSVQHSHEIRLLKGAADEVAWSGAMIGCCDRMQTLQLLARKVAPTRATVLIQGESGTGKEVLARYIHRRSSDPDAPFLAINCAALSATLLESELFGHVKGAFTGAERDKKGLFVEAGAGTLFLDEIGELALELQAKILRALQEREVRPVGGLRSLPIHARIIAATNRDLKDMAAKGQFRRDLYYRLSVFPLEIPPLRERGADILALAKHFLRQLDSRHAGFSPRAVRALESYSWPGNVRELGNWVEHALICAGDECVEPQHFPSSGHALMDPLDAIGHDLPTLRELSRRYAMWVMKRSGSNKAETARILDVGTTTLWRMLRSEACAGR